MLAHDATNGKQLERHARTLTEKTIYAPGDRK